MTAPRAVADSALGDPGRHHVSPATTCTADPEQTHRTTRRRSERPMNLRAPLRRFYGELDAPIDRAPRAWPTYMTARVAADYSDTSPWTIRRKVPPCGRRGRSFVYSIEAVEQWMRGSALSGALERGSDPRKTVLGSDNGGGMGRARRNKSRWRSR